MSLDPDIAIEDLKRYVDAFDLVLSESAESIFRRVEDLGHKYDYHPEYRFFLCPILERVKKIQSLVIQEGGDPIAAAANVIQKIEGTAHNSLHDGYDLEYPPYSTSERHGDTRTRLADLAIAIARRNRHSGIHASSVYQK